MNSPGDEPTEVNPPGNEPTEVNPRGDEASQVIPPGSGPAAAPEPGEQAGPGGPARRGQRGIGVLIGSIVASLVLVGAYALAGGPVARTARLIHAMPAPGPIPRISRKPPSNSHCRPPTALPVNSESAGKNSPLDRRRPGPAGLHGRARVQRIRP